MADSDRLQPPKAAKELGYTISRRVPRRLGQVRALGRSLRALTSTKRAK